MISSSREYTFLIWYVSVKHIRKHQKISQILLHIMRI